MESLNMPYYRVVVRMAGVKHVMWVQAEDDEDALEQGEELGTYRSLGMGIEFEVSAEPISEAVFTAERGAAARELQGSIDLYVAQCIVTGRTEGHTEEERRDAEDLLLTPVMFEEEVFMLYHIVSARLVVFCNGRMTERNAAQAFNAVMAELEANSGR